MMRLPRVIKNIEPIAIIFWGLVAVVVIGAGFASYTLYQDHKSAENIIQQLSVSPIKPATEREYKKLIESQNELIKGLDKLCDDMLKDMLILELEIKLYQNDQQIKRGKKSMEENPKILI
jgi:hypothetical protein